MSETSFSSSPEPGGAPKSPVKRSQLVWVFLLLGLFVLLASMKVFPVVLRYAKTFMQAVDPRPFDREEWLDRSWRATAGFHTLRQEMVDDLLERKLVVGMPMNEVHWLIGPPDEKPRYRAGDWTYYLGDERGMLAADSEWLAIDFDELGRVSRVELETD